MSSPIIPWELSTFPTELQDELNRRKINRSFKYVNNSKANWNENGDWVSYRGPMVSWIRFCSNGAGHQNSVGQFDRKRFVLHSGKGFYQSYGFQPSSFPAQSYR